MAAKTLCIDDLLWAPDGFHAHPQDQRIIDSLRESRDAAEKHQCSAANRGGD